jgi:hypothetical protein
MRWVLQTTFSLPKNFHHHTIHTSEFAFETFNPVRAHRTLGNSRQLDATQTAWSSPLPGPLCSLLGQSWAKAVQTAKLVLAPYRPVWSSSSSLSIRIASVPGRDYELTCISSKDQTECSATQGVVFGEGNCDQADIENMFQDDGYCHPRTFFHGAKVFCEDDNTTITSVAYNLATWGNCKKQHVDCSAGALQYLYIDYCCEKIQGWIHYSSIAVAKVLELCTRLIVPVGVVCLFIPLALFVR